MRIPGKVFKHQLDLELAAPDDSQHPSMMMMVACAGGKRHLLQGGLDAASLLSALTAGEQVLGVPAPAPQAQSELNAVLGGIQRAFGSPSPSGSVPYRVLKRISRLTSRRHLTSSLQARLVVSASPFTRAGLAV